MKVKVRKYYGTNKSSAGSRRWDPGKLKALEIEKRFRESIAEKISEIPAKEGGHSIEDQWSMLSGIMEGTADELCSNDRTGVRNGWYDSECEEAVKLRNEKRNAFLCHDTRQTRKEFKEARSKAKMICRKKKRLAMAQRIKEIESSRGNNETRKFFREVKEIKMGYRPQQTMIRDEKGELLTMEDEVTKRWERHFRQQLKHRQCVANRENQEENELGNEEEEGGEEELPPEAEDIADIISKLKNYKAAGSDSITAELFKAAGPVLVSEMYELVFHIWQEEKIPCKWKESLVIPIYKRKGDPTECSNYRGISLLNVAYKIFAIALYNRLVPYMEKIVDDYQAGFRKNMSTIDQIFTLKQVGEKMTEFGHSLWVLFVDFEAAYDTVSREELYRAMLEMNIPRKLIKLTRCTMENNKCQVRVSGRNGCPFGVGTGLRQGDALAPLLFNMVLHKIISKTKLNHGYTIYTRMVQILAYADDIAIVGRTRASMEEAFLEIEREAKKMGLKVNTSKTKVMSIGKENYGAHQQQVTLGNHTFGVVSAFQYLGCTISRRLEEDTEIRSRLGAANRAYYSLNKLMRSRLLTRKTKIRIYKTLIRPVAVYACETWTLNKTTVQMLDRFERKILRRILGPVKENERWRLRKNREVYQEYKDLSLSNFVRIQRLKWFGHMSRMEDGRIPKKAYNFSPDGTRARGRPRARWRDNVLKDLKQTRISTTMARDRNSWGKMIERAKDCYMRLSCL
ncbi:reverse transcriptase family protein [Pantoea sp. Morm]|uniref:reverse transcriptase family protein n=1 Tax=Pantoea sp. Morm TaxID=2601250 RepID=UPI0031FDD26B